MELALVFGASIGVALAYDAIVGERPLLTHPVIYFGKVISILEPRLNSGMSHHRDVLGGVALPVALLAISALPGIILHYLMGLSSHTWISMIALSLILAYLVKTSFAIRAMNREALAVTDYLQSGDLDNARRQVSYIVSRPTGELDEAGVLSATVECVGESIVDGVISPLFYGIIAGLYGCLGYRAINTADSRVGYRSKRYVHFGMPSARLDDILNIVPARLAVAETILAAGALRMNVRRGISVWARDRNVTASPNAGHTMALYAGILGIRLEKEGHYVLGDAVQPLSPNHVTQACKLMNATSVLHAVLCILAILLLPLPFIVV